MRKLAIVPLSVIAVVVSLGISSTAWADMTIFATGFENQPYTTGPLAGQDGWFGWSLSHVQTTEVNGGSQAVATDATEVSGQRITGHALIYDSVNNPESIVTLGVDFMTPGVNGNPDSVAWGLLAQGGDAGFFGQMKVLPTGRVWFDDVGEGPMINFGQWQRYELEYDFGNRTVTAFLDGVSFGSAAMVGASTSLTSTGIGIVGSSDTPESTGYFDNISVVSRVPAPGAAMLGLIGIPLVGWFKRRVA